MQAQIISAVLIQGRRPSFEVGGPPGYAALAQACWTQDPRQRPTAQQIEQRLAAMLAAL